MKKANYAVVFTSFRPQADDGYDEMAARMDALTREQPGFVSIESVRNAEGKGITICTWESLEAVKEWKKNLEHREAQKLGKEKWYREYTVRVCKIEEEYGT